MSSNVGLLWHNIEQFDNSNAFALISLKSLHYLSLDNLLEPYKYR